MADTPTPVPAASERMTAERIATFLGEIENIAALLQRTWTGGSVSDPVADVLANAASLIRTLSARAEAAEARAETARDLALKACRKAMRDCFDEEFESLQEGLMTDADITDKEREAMRWQLNALDVWREDMPDRAELYAIAALTAPPPTAKEAET